MSLGKGVVFVVTSDNDVSAPSPANENDCYLEVPGERITITAES